MSWNLKLPRLTQVRLLLQVRLHEQPHRVEETLAALLRNVRGLSNEQIATALSLTPQQVVEALSKADQSDADSHADRLKMIDAANGTTMRANV